MSQYYAGYYGIGCVLSVEEFENFLTSYFTKHPDLTEKEQEEVRIEEYAFKRSNENGIFHIVEISTDYADGMQLLRLNKEDDPAGYCVDLRGKDHYVVIFCENDPDCTYEICDKESFENAKYEVVCETNKCPEEVDY